MWSDPDFRVALVEYLNLSSEAREELLAAPDDALSPSINDNPSSPHYDASAAMDKALMLAAIRDNLEPDDLVRRLKELAEESDEQAVRAALDGNEAWLHAALTRVSRFGSEYSRYAIGRAMLPVIDSVSYVTDIRAHPGPPLTLQPVSLIRTSFDEPPSTSGNIIVFQADARSLDALIEELAAARDELLRFDTVARDWAQRDL